MDAARLGDGFGQWVGIRAWDPTVFGIDLLTPAVETILFNIAHRQWPGTILVREWQGTTHHATVVADGFIWNGRSYSSLSAIARAITGTKWNGPRFFGLREDDDRV